MCKVVHWKKDDYDVFIGRTVGYFNKWSNPYSHKDNANIKEEFKTETREESIEKFEIYLLNNKELMDDLKSLMYKTLGCWCKGKGGKGGKKCHGDIIAKYVNRLEHKKEREEFLKD